MRAETASPFDALAAEYDEAFTRSAIGRVMRQAVWRHLDATFTRGDRVLELSCGTGEDALRLARRGVRVLATDISEGMLAIARAKVERAGLAGLVEVHRLDIAALGAFAATSAAAFDGALSNFGGLNCIADQRGVAVALARLLRPGARALLCVMGPIVPWEAAWYLWQRKPGRAFRRLRPGGVPWRGLTISYPAIGALRRVYAPWFICRQLTAVGALVPPSYAESWARARPLALWALQRIERRFEAVPALPWLADHYLIEFERR